MKRRGGASGQRPKAARRSTAPKRRAARKPAGRRKPPESDRQSQLQDCTRELNAARDQLTAMSEVVSVISGSSGDLKPVFDVLLANAVRICGARFGNLSLVDGDGMRMVAMHNAPPEFEKLRRREPIILLERSPLGALFHTKKIVHIGDLAADKAYANAGLVKVAGARAALCVPMFRGDDLIGALVLYRMEPLPFSDKQVELLTNLASQAVIAIENVRLLNELRESLARQTATSEILRVISQSPTDVRPVFDSIVLTARAAAPLRLGVRASLRRRYIFACGRGLAERPARGCRAHEFADRSQRQLSLARDPRQKNAAPAGLVAHRAARARAHHP